MNVRENWRIVVLVVLVVLSGVALFIPGGNASPATNATNGTNGTQADTDTGLTNLQYGLELSGGSRIRGQPIGITAEGVSLPREPEEISSLQSTVANELGIDLINVSVRTARDGGAVEVFTGTVNESEFQQALSAAGLDVSDDQIRDGVTEQTLQTTQNVITNRVNAVGISGGSASIVRSATGQDFIVVEVPNREISEVQNVITDRGSVRIVATYPTQTENGTVYRNTTVLEQDDFAGISPAQQAGEGLPPRVPVSLTPAAAQSFAQDMIDFGFTGQGAGNCRAEANPDNPGWCLYTVDDGEVIYSAGLSPDLAGDMETGAFENSRSFVLQTRSFNTAQAVQISLESGALPTTLDVQSTYYLNPSLAQSFKPLALLTGLAAWLVVSGVVFYRYREIRIAIPMLATAGAEVFILLGFAATVGLALDLSHIAGLIAVIGTGVDDLIIIADEILQEGKVATGRVFQNRFRKAFWVIGAAAATTIIAMSPLAVLSLGDLQGFAIVTIVGVLIGVLITRPAYGDVLRNLLISEE
jgi:preprotein translocase subunit SecD